MVDLNFIQILLILIVALFAGFESVLDVFQLHQPIITGALIGAITGQVLTMFVRTLAVGLGHYADRKAEDGNIRGVEVANLTGLLLQGLRVALPAAAVIAVPAETVTAAIQAIPDWITGGLAVGG